MKNRIIVMLYLLVMSVSLLAVEVIENTKQFSTLLASGAPAVVLFYEDVTQQTQKLIDTFDSVGQDKEGLSFIRINVMFNGLRKIADTYNIQTFPAILLFDGRDPIKDDGHIVMLTGYVSSQAMHNFIDRYFARVDDADTGYNDDVYYDDRPVVVYRDRPAYWGYPYYYPWPYYYRYGGYWGGRRYYHRHGYGYGGYRGRGRYHRSGSGRHSTVRTGGASRPARQVTGSRPVSSVRPTGGSPRVSSRPAGASGRSTGMRAGGGMRSGGMRSGGGGGGRGGGRGGRR